MHSFDWKGKAWNEDRSRPDREEETTVTIHHNGDYSGNVKINVPTRVGQPSVHNYSAGGEDYHDAELSVPYEALEALVLAKWQSDIVSDIEEMEDFDAPKMLLVGSILRLLKAER